MPTSEPKFHFCIARKWRQNEPLTRDNICMYWANQHEFHYGTQEYAESILNHALVVQARLPASYPRYEYDIVRFIQIGD